MAHKINNIFYAAKKKYKIFFILTILVNNIFYILLKGFTFVNKNYNDMTNRIEILIKEKGHTLTSLAEKIGTTKQNLFGKLKSPSYPTLCEIATALDVPLWQLFISAEEIAGYDKGITCTCPHCGKELSIKIEG